MNKLIAITSWQDRVSPVFDAAQKLLLYELDGKSEIGRHEKNLAFSAPGNKIQILIQSKANILICGAITEQIKRRIEDAGIRVFSFICGDISSIMQAFIANRDIESEFAMPGCKNRRFRHRRGRFTYLN